MADGGRRSGDPGSARGCRDREGAPASGVVGVPGGGTVTEGERRFEQAETVFQHVQDGVFLVDVTEDGRYEFRRVNPAYEEITGLTERDVRGQTPSEVIPDPVIAEEVETAMEAIVERQDSRHLEHVVETPEGTNHLSVWIAPVVVDETVVSLVGVIRDVTGQRERQRELELKTRAMDEAPIAISIVEPDDTDVPMVYVNEGFQDLTGYDEAEALGSDWSMLGGEETDPETVEAFEASLANEEPLSTEMQYYMKDGTPRWAQVSVSPIHDADGELTHVVGFHQDITERKEYETEIERRFDEFADMFAAELHTPIDEARDALADARESGDEAALADAEEWLERADGLLSDLAEIHSFSVPSRDHSESAFRGPADDGE